MPSGARVAPRGVVRPCSHAAAEWPTRDKDRHNLQAISFPRPPSRSRRSAIGRSQNIDAREWLHCRSTSARPLTDKSPNPGAPPPTSLPNRSADRGLGASREAGEAGQTGLHGAAGAQPAEAGIRKWRIACAVLSSACPGVTNKVRLSSTGKAGPDHLDRRRMKPSQERHLPRETDRGAGMQEDHCAGMPPQRADESAAAWYTVL